MRYSGSRSGKRSSNLRKKKVRCWSASVSPAGQDKTAPVIRRPAGDGVDICLVVAQPGQRGHETHPGGDAGGGNLRHGGKAFFARRCQVFHLTGGGGERGIGRRDHTEGSHGARPAVDVLQQVQVAQDQRRAFQHHHRETQLQAHLQHGARYLELALGRLVIAGEDRIARQPFQRPAQQSGGVFLHLDHVCKILGIVVGRILLLPAIAEQTAMLATQVRISRIARPEPVVGALAFVEDRLWLVEDELCAAGHRGIILVGRLRTADLHRWRRLRRWLAFTPTAGFIGSHPGGYKWDLFTCRV